MNICPPVAILPGQISTYTCVRKTGTTSIELRETRLYGTRELRSFRSAATKYLQDYNHKKRIKDDALQLKHLDQFIGRLGLKQVHMGSLQDFIAKRRQDG